MLTDGTLQFNLKVHLFIPLRASYIFRSRLHFSTIFEYSFLKYSPFPLPDPIHPLVQGFPNILSQGPQFPLFDDERASKQFFEHFREF